MCHSKRTANALSFVQTSRVMLAGCLLLVVGLGFAAASVAAQPRQGNPLAAVSIYRTIVAHELAKPIPGGKDYLPKISGDGNRIVFVSFDSPNTHEYLYLANFDGSNVQLLTDRIYGQYSDLQISDNGQRIAMTDGFTDVWVFQPGVASPRSYRPFGDPIILHGFTLTGNGGQIYFVISDDSVLWPSGLVVQRGVYRMNFDGTGLQRIVSPEMIALATGEDISTFNSIDIGGMFALSVSQDGARLALGIFNNNRSLAWLLAYDGQLRLLRPKGGYSDIMVSADGSTLVANGGSSDPNTYVMTWEGVEVRVVPGESNCSIALQVTGNGSQFLVDCQGNPMIDVATGARRLYFGRGSFQVPLNALMAGGMENPSMSRDGKRFTFSTNSPYTGNTIVTVEADPLSLSGAPQISNPALNPAFLQSQFGSLADLSFNVALPANTGLNIGTGATYQGQDVLSISLPSWYEAEPGGSYSSTIAAGNALSGFYTYRIVADIMAPDSRRHAAAVYFGPLIVDAAPPVSAAINYLTGQPGSYFTVTGSGFQSGALLTAAVNGAILSNSLFANEDGQLVFYLDTSQAQPGRYMVAIYTNTTGHSLQSAVATVYFTLSAGAPERPLAGIQPVFIVPAGLELHEVYLPLVLRGQ